MNNYPVFPEFKDLEIEDKEFLTNWFKKYPLNLNAYSFNNLFCWKDYGNYKWSIWNKFLFIYFENSIHRDLKGFIAPCGEGDYLSAIDTQFKYLQEIGINKPVIKLVCTKYLDILKNTKYTIQLDLDNSDYIYDTKSFINLKGRKYARKRNLIKNFTSLYTPTFKPLTLDLISDCINLEKKWCEYKNCEHDPELIYENKALLRALNYFDRLDLKGGVCLVNNKVYGFSIGSKLNNDMAVVHFEKADVEFKGIYQYIAREFANFFANYKYINREQDMGNLNLRKAKESYFPIFKELAYDIYLNY